MIIILTTIWKWEVDSLRRQVCAWTAALPPILDEDAAADLEEGAPLPLKDVGSGYAALGSSGYANDKSRAKMCAWQVLLPGPGGIGCPGGRAPGSPNPSGGTFRQLGVDVAIGGSRTTGPVLSRHLESGRSALRRLPNLSTYDCRERAINTLVTPLALHGVAVALVTDPDLRGLETAVVRALWGATCLSRAKEIVFSVLSKGHRISPVMHTWYERLLWLARMARRPGFTEVFTQAIWESGGCPPVTGPVGRALQTAATVGWSPREGWWCWDVPGQEHLLHFV